MGVTVNLEGMTEKQRIALLMNSIGDVVNKRDIAGFLKEETHAFAANLNSRKLERLVDNITMFKRYVYLLDDQYTKQLGLCYTTNMYYISQRGLALLKQKGNRKPQACANYTSDSSSHLVRVSSKVKAMFLFQATEFCNGSRDRMKIIDFAKIRASIVRKCSV